MEADNLSFSEALSASIGDKQFSGIETKDGFTPRGRFFAEFYHENGELFHKEDITNLVTNGGKDDILNVYFHSSTQTLTWYIGLIDSSGYTAIAATDTMAAHAGWNEFTTYSETVRQTWGVGASSGQSVTNATPATFSISGSGTVKGIFVTTVNTKSGTTGTLWSAALFAAAVAVVNGDSLKITYTVNAG